MESRIVEELRKTYNPFNRILAASIERRANSNIFRIPKDIYIDSANEEKAYTLLKRMVTKDTKTKLDSLDHTIDSISDDIYDRTGWWRTDRDGFMLEDNFQNMHDHEFRSFDTFRICRNEDGYYVEGGEPFNSYFAYIQDTEYRFLESNREQLSVLHDTLCEKENTLVDSIPLKDEANRSLTVEIIKYLGYSKEKRPKEKTKKDS